MSTSLVRVLVEVTSITSAVRVRRLDMEHLRPTFVLHDDFEEDGNIRAYVLDAGQFEIDRAFREDECAGIVGQERLEHGPEIKQIVIVGVGMENVIPELGMESVVEGERHVFESFGAVRVPDDHVPTAARRSIVVVVGTGGGDCDFVTVLMMAVSHFNRAQTAP